MATQSDLVKIGKEGFAIIDEFFGQKSSNYHVLPPPQRPAAPSKQKAPPATPVCRYPYRPQQAYQPQQALVYQMMNPVAISEEKTTYYDAIKLHDELPIMVYPKRKSAAMAY